MTDAARVLFNEDEGAEGDEAVTSIEEAMAEAESTDPETDPDPTVDESAEETVVDDDESESDDDDPEAEEVPAAAALRFANQQEAERAYAEAQAEMNRLRNQQWQQQGQAPQPAPQDLDYAAIAQNDPLQAFHLAMENDPQVASRLIARVQTDSQRHMSLAIIAQEEGDEERAQTEHNRAYNAQMLAQEMTETKMRSEYEQQLAPDRERRFQEDLFAAAGKAGQAVGGLDEQTAAAVEQFVTQNQHLMGDWSAEAMERGFAFAISQVRAPAAVDNTEIEALRAENAALKAKKRDRATAGGAGRSAPGRSSTQSSEEDEGDEMAADLLGSGSRPSGMQILFGN